MGKFLGGLFRLIFVLLILGLTGYNSWQIATLRGEVAALKRERRGAVVDGGSHLAEARRYAERARNFLRIEEYAAAQQELSRAREALSEATRDVREGGEGAVREARDAVDALSNKVNALWPRERLSGKEGEKKKP